VGAATGRRRAGGGGTQRLPGQTQTPGGPPRAPGPAAGCGRLSGPGAGAGAGTGPGGRACGPRIGPAVGPASQRGPGPGTGGRPSLPGQCLRRRRHRGARAGATPPLRLSATVKARRRPPAGPCVPVTRTGGPGWTVTLQCTGNPARPVLEWQATVTSTSNNSVTQLENRVQFTSGILTVTVGQPDIYRHMTTYTLYMWPYPMPCQMTSYTKYMWSYTFPEFL
jgi:hypothetical protein